MDKDKLIEMLIKEKGGTRTQYLSLLNKIAYHESAHTMDPSIKQKGGGPGRGKYQFEEGKNAGGITAARRTKQYLNKKGLEVPEWLEQATASNSLDATQLDSEQQDILFLGNMRMHPKADFSDYVSGDMSTEDFWANYHWAGNSEDRAKRLDSFNTSMSSFSGSEIAHTQTKKPEATVQLPRVEQAVDNTAVAQQDYSKMQMSTAPSLANIPADNGTQKDLISYIKEANKFDLNEFNTGGKHEQNPRGGIPQGVGQNGRPNTVEEGETSFDIDGDKFIFSDRVSLTDYVNKKGNFKQGTSNAFALGGNMTDPTDPKLKTVKAKDNTRVNTPSIKIKDNPLNIISTEDKTKDFVLDYLQSEPYKKRMVNSGYEDPNKTTQERIKNIKEVDINYQENNIPFVGKLGKVLSGENFANYTSQYFTNDNSIIMRPDIEPQVEETMVHELGHGIESANRGNNYTGLSERDKKEFSNRLRKDNILSKHDEKPSENYSDFLSLRYMLKEAGVFDSTKESDINIKHLSKFENNVGKNKDLWNRIRRLYEPKDIIWIMNNIADNKKINKTNSRLT